MFITILGRQPEISIAELEAVYGAKNVQKISNQAATVNCDNFQLTISAERLNVDKSSRR